MSRRRWRHVLPAQPRIGGKDYSVYNPGQVRQGLRLWLETLLRVLPGEGAGGDGEEGSGGAG